MKQLLHRDKSEAVAQAYSNIGIAYARWGKLDQARAITLAQEHTDTSARAIMTGNIEIVWQHLGDAGQALAPQLKALQLWQASTDAFRGSLMARKMKSCSPGSCTINALQQH